jgi:4-hydroxybenzoate polyprenyltransferase
VNGKDNPHRLGQFIGRAAAATRAGEWWTNKLAPLLGSAYAAAVVLHAPMPVLWPLLARLLLAVIPGAAYVSVLNDLTDLDDDRRCGKSNRLAGFSPAARAALLAICLLLGLGGGWLLRPYPITCLIYAANWIPYTLYSAPPWRLKARGGWGVLMDACGAHLLPALWTVSLIAEGAGKKLPAPLPAPKGVLCLAPL